MEQNLDLDFLESPEFLAELAEAEAEYDANPDAGEPMEKVFADLRKMIIAEFFMKEAV